MEEDDEYNCTDNNTSTSLPASTKVSFHASDTTVEIPHPRRYIVVGPSTHSTTPPDVLFFALPHPRHQQPVQFGLSFEKNAPTTSPSLPLLVEVQERKPNFANLWFLNDNVEPQSPLYVLNRFDAMWLAIAMSTPPMLPTAFASKMITFSEMLQRSRILQHVTSSSADSSYSQSQQGGDDESSSKDNAAAVQRVVKYLGSILEGALHAVCDVRSIEDDDVDEETGAQSSTNYFRFSEEKCNALLKARHRQLCGCAALRRLLGVEDTASPPPAESSGDATSQQQTVAVPDDAMLLMLHERAFGLVQEYLPPTLVEAASRACLGEAHQASSSLVTPTRRSTTDDTTPGSGAAHSGNYLDKPKPVAPPKPQLKSASVKRLEKAGPPKGTPTLFQMFAKKQQQQSQP